MGRLLYIGKFFYRYEFLGLVLLIKSILVVLRRNAAGTDREKTLGHKLRLSDFLTLFLLIYVIIIAKIPLSTIFQRYFIILQPVLTVILLLDISAVFDLVFRIDRTAPKKLAVAAVSCLISLFFIAGVLQKSEHISGHIYELFRQYKGPLDVVIPYVRQRYNDPESLVMAVNYEECSYMYYLKSKVVIDFVGNNLREDMKVDPDIVIFRKWWAQPSSVKIFNAILNGGQFTKVSFRIFDYPVNNIPELGSILTHQYRTMIAKDAKNRLDIYIRE